MGKNANQIATFANLYSIGYRVPSDKIYSKEGVTYDDLRSMDAEYNLDASMHNVCIDRSYYNGSQNLSYDTSESELKEFSGTFSTNTTLITSEEDKSKLIGTLKIPPEAGVVYFPSSKIYIKLLSFTGYSYSNFDFSVRLCIRDQRNIYMWTHEWTNIAGGSTVDYSQGKSVKFTIPSLTQLEPNNTYYLYLEYKYSGKSGYTSGCYVAFERGPMYFQAYSGNKCVPWSGIRGSDGQDPNEIPLESHFSSAACVPVTCYLKEEIDGVGTKASDVVFYYCYKTEGSTEVSVATVGICGLAEGKVDGSAKETVDVLINPKISEEIVTEDYLMIWCGTTGSKQSWYYKCETYSGENSVSDWEWINYANSVSKSFTDVSYHDMLRDLKQISFKVD